MKKDQQSVRKTNPGARRKFLKNSTTLVAGLPLMSGLFPFSPPTGTLSKREEQLRASEVSKSLIGGYGDWAASLLKKRASLSFRNEKWTDVDIWRKEAVAKTEELLAAPELKDIPKVTVENKYNYDGLDIEELSWQLPYGRPTRAVVLKPQGASKPLPGILGLHDHGGNKYFGLRKITKTSGDQHPLMIEHQKSDYGGKPWANEVAKRGYVVLVHDTYAFASRRVLYSDVAGIKWGQAKIGDKTDENPEGLKNIQTYNDWSRAHEDIMAKSLFCAGTTWPGVVLAEDQIALSILGARSDVESKRMGCAGLSGGGLRTVYLGGMDERVKCAICVGFMSTWEDFLRHKSYTHTWMTFAPLLPKYLDFPEILGLRTPLPTLVQSSTEDGLYTLSEMKKADEILKEVYAKAGAQDKYKTNFYRGGHKFDLEMQADAFDWFDQWLG
ncbi:MAG: hypothetical protein RIG77_15590 [Cyclobacteriaceae bacterium]